MTNRESWDNFARKTLPQLKSMGYIKETNPLVYVITSFLIGVLISGVLFYGIYYDKFKSSIIQDVNVEPQINITSQTSNSFNFDPKTENDYEHKIYINTTNYINNFLTCP